MAVALIPNLFLAEANEGYAPALETLACTSATGASIPLVFISDCRATSNSLSFALLTVGYARSKEASALITAEATAILVNHLLSAGITYQGAYSVAVFRIVSSYAYM